MTDTIEQLNAIHAEQLRILIAQQSQLVQALRVCLSYLPDDPDAEHTAQALAALAAVEKGE